MVHGDFQVCNGKQYGLLVQTRFYNIDNIVVACEELEMKGRSLKERKQLSLVVLKYNNIIFISILKKNHTSMNSCFDSEGCLSNSKAV
ncbi:MAG: hypothetical protein K0R24_2396 [Gammaproteobacteria bacterium]|jgi:hypothetical protein|nr:hypothetical protein [Gammaproteobacteria bacterium]MCE3239415.1 hypothetical protein [Gammaproteobacteria bacterium]